MLANSTEAFENTGLMLSTTDNDSLGVDAENRSKSSTQHQSTTQSIPSTSSTAALKHFSTLSPPPPPLQQDCFVFPPAANDQHVATSNPSGVTSASSLTKFSSMTSSYDSGGRSSSNTSTFTTMRPCKCYPLQRRRRQLWISYVRCHLPLPSPRRQLGDVSSELCNRVFYGIFDCEH